MFAFLRPRSVGRALAGLVAVATWLGSGCHQVPRPLGSGVPFPTGYRQWYHVRTMLIEAGNPLHDAFGGIHHVYANDLARQGLVDGQYADGAVLVLDLLAAESGDRAVLEGPRKMLAVMHRSAAAHAATGGWGFASFDGSGTDQVTDMVRQCYLCHQLRAAEGHVFSRLRP
jgi:hypothetical protein